MRVKIKKKENSQWEHISFDIWLQWLRTHDEKKEREDWNVCNLYSDWNDCLVAICASLNYPIFCSNIIPHSNQFFSFRWHWKKHFQENDEFIALIFIVYRWFFFYLSLPFIKPENSINCDCVLISIHIYLRVHCSMHLILMLSYGMICYNLDIHWWILPKPKLFLLHISIQFVTKSECHKFIQLTEIERAHLIAL